MPSILYGVMRIGYVPQTKCGTKQKQTTCSGCIATDGLYPTTCDKVIRNWTAIKHFGRYQCPHERVTPISPVTRSTWLHRLHWLHRVYWLHRLHRLHWLHRLHRLHWLHRLHTLVTKQPGETSASQRGQRTQRIQPVQTRVTTVTSATSSAELL